MLPIILFIISVFVLIIAVKQGNKSNDNDGWCALGFVSAAAAIAFFCGSIGANCTTYQKQIDHIEEAKKCLKIKKIYQKKSDDLIRQLTHYLAIQYPKFEKEIFKSISLDKLDVCLAKFPEIKSSETLIKLTDGIKQLKSEIYNQDIKKEEELKEIRCNLKGIWSIRWLIPEPPEEIVQQ